MTTVTTQRKLIACALLLEYTAYDHGIYVQYTPLLFYAALCSFDEYLV
jgi:hypothetical protein